MPELQQQAIEVLRAMREREPSERATFLHEACAGDPALRAEVESLLAPTQPAAGFPATPTLIDGAASPVEIKVVYSDQVSTKSEAAVLSPGTLVDGHYLIEKELGRGGMGVVFLARDQELHNMPVVIKVLLESFNDVKLKRWVEKKFKQEIAALARIDHPGVVRALGVGELPDGRTYLVMQYVSGENLRSVMTSTYGMELERAGKLIRQIGQALTAAHEQLVIHRDLKPENIMLQTVDEEEYVKLIDFGIATVLELPTTAKTTTVAGTYEYMAHEQFKGKPSEKSDIYALGVIAYEMVTGRLPFNCDSFLEYPEVQRAGVRAKPRDLRSSLPEAAQAAILKALAYNPQNRYARAKDLGDVLAQALISEIPKPPSELELAHVLFGNLVGYSMLTLDEQASRLGQLLEIVSGTGEFQRALESDHLIRLATEDGDGMVLVFFGDPLAPVKCALEIADALKGRPEIKLRMGVHTGLVQRVSDINGNPSVSGIGIKMARRVMDCGDAGHILLSKTLADVLSQLNEWSGSLYDCGEHDVKHGVSLHIFNLYTGELGNPRPIATHRKRTARLTLLLVASLLVIVILGTIAWQRYASVNTAIGTAETSNAGFPGHLSAAPNITVTSDDESPSDVRWFPPGLGWDIKGVGEYKGRWIGGNKAGLFKWGDTTRFKMYCDFRLTLDMRLINGKGAAWIIRAQDDKNYYLFELNTSNGMFTFYKYINGQPETKKTFSVKDFLGKEGDSYNLVVEVEGDKFISKIKASSDDSDKLYTIDESSDNTYRCGGIGFKPLDGSNMLLQNLSIEEASGNKTK